MQDYDSLSPAPINPLGNSKKKPQSKVRRFISELTGYVPVVFIGTLTSAFLFVYVPAMISYRLDGLDYNYSVQYAINDIHVRYAKLMHGDFSRLKDWGFPLFGGSVAAGLKLLFQHD